MAEKQKTGEETIYQLKIALKNSKPPIWRRVLVPSDLTLERLHYVIQRIMDWEDYHLHEFRKGERIFGPPEEAPDLGFDVPDNSLISALFAGLPEVEDEAAFKLGDLLKRHGDKLDYLYDFGDSWEHVITLEKELPPEPGQVYPVCIKGKRAAPPEDSGGIWGYAMKLDILQNPDHPDYEHVVEWMGADFAPEAFDLDEVNEALAHLRENWPTGRPAGFPSMVDDMFSDEELSPAEMEEIRDAVLDTLALTLEEVQELPDGYRLRFESGGVSWMLAANLAALEYADDTSLSFRLELEPNEGPIWLQVTGENAKQIMKDDFDL